MSDGATMTIDTASFSRQIETLKGITGRSARSVVRFWSWKAVPRVAYATAIAVGRYEARGRARAGWWPAAIAIGASTVYTRHPNAGEGSAIDNTSDATVPSFTMVNSVPYITRIVGIAEAIGGAFTGLESWARAQAERAFQQAWAAGGAT